MNKLTINNLTFKYKNSVDYLFQDSNLNFKKGFTCLSGSNGCGKTTLLKIIAKEIKTDIPLNGYFSYYCEQSVEDIPKDFDEFIYAFDKRALQLKQKLDIEKYCFYSWNKLSCGVKKRIQIAIALFKNPDVLLLDEPTNHLDDYNKNLIQEILFKYENICIIVSHDRIFLDEICDETVFLINKKFYNYKTNFTNALKEYDKFKLGINNKINKDNKKIKHLDELIQSQKEKISKSKKRISKRNIHKKDISLKEKINLAKLTGKDKKDGKILRNFENHQNKIKNTLNTIVEKDFSDDIEFNLIDSKKNFPYYIKKDAITLDKNIIIFEDIYINKNDKIAIKGPNSCGKTSFIKYLISKIDTLDYCYIPQEISKSESIKLKKEINILSKEKLSKIFTIIKKLNSNPKNIIYSKNLSEGEIKKLFIAKSILDGNYIMILDEPTNHMDIKSILLLEKALKNYNGALIIVSHDDIFLSNIVNRIFKFYRKTIYTQEIKEDRK